jgi:hypothetical protein
MICALLSAAPCVLSAQQGYLTIWVNARRTVYTVRVFWVVRPSQCDVRQLADAQWPRPGCAVILDVAPVRPGGAESLNTRDRLVKYREVHLPRLGFRISKRVQAAVISELLLRVEACLTSTRN